MTRTGAQLFEFRGGRPPEGGGAAKGGAASTDSSGGSGTQREVLQLLSMLRPALLPHVAQALVCSVLPMAQELHIMRVDQPARGTVAMPAGSQGDAQQEGGLSDYSDAEALGVMKRILEIKRIVTGEDSHDAGDARALVPVPQPGAVMASMCRIPSP